MRILVSMALLFLLGCSSQPPTWKFLKEGEVARVEYAQGNWSVNSKTIIYFIDGSTQVLTYSQSIPNKKIKIYECHGNCNEYYKIEAQ